MDRDLLIVGVKKLLFSCYKTPVFQFQVVNKLIIREQIIQVFNKLIIREQITQVFDKLIIREQIIQVVNKLIIREQIIQVFVFQVVNY